MKRRVFSVFGEPVVADSGQSLAEQTFSVLRGEIQAGRWELGERLPSIVALSTETGLGKSPIRQAYERLRARGYVCQEGRSGTILISMEPGNETAGRVIGVATRFQLTPSGHLLGGAEDMRFHAIADVARRSGCAVEVVSFADSEDVSHIDALSGPFSERVDGIVSLFDFPHPWTPLLEPDRIPIVFFLDPSGRSAEIGEGSAPAVTGDVHNGFYLATQEALSLGHRDIVFFGAASRTPALTEACWSGHCRAMAAACAEPNEEAYRKSLSLADRDLSAAAEYLESFPDATAILCETMVVAHNLIAAAEFKGIDVPGDVSVIGHGYGAMRPGDSGPMSSVAYDIPHAVRCCLDLLSEQARTRVCSTTRVVVQPVFREGASLGVPRHLAQRQLTDACLEH